MKLTMQVFIIEHFANYIIEEKLVGKKSRLRSRLFNSLSERIKQYQKEYNQLIEEYSVKDDDGKTIKETNEKGEEMIHLTDTEKFKEEFDELLNESFSIDIDEELKAILEEIFFETEREFSREEAILYDQLCEIVEEIK